MKTTGLFAMFAVALVGLVYLSGAEAASVGVPMMYEIRPERSANQVLADLVEKSLALDSSGNAVMEGSPCVTPNHYAEAIRRYHPGSRLTGVKALPAYLRALIHRPAPSGTFRMSRMLKTVFSGRTSCVLDTEGWTRTFKSGEGAWYDPNTGLVVLAGDCSNVVEDKPPAVVRPPVTAGSGCPANEKGHYIRVWRDDLITPELRARAYQLIAQSIDFVSPAFSRTLGEELRNCAKGGSCRLAPGNYKIRRSWLREGSDHAILAEYAVEEIEAVNGFYFTQNPIYETNPDAIIRLVFEEQQPDGRVVMPKVSPRTKVREIRDYPKDRPTKPCRHHTHVLLAR